VRRKTQDLLARVKPRGHIVNLGHGILPETPLASVEALVEAVHAERLAG
jgi:uroporphyrinogen decarboxylase